MDVLVCPMCSLEPRLLLHHVLEHLLLLWRIRGSVRHRDEHWQFRRHLQNVPMQDLHVW